MIPIKPGVGFWEQALQNFEKPLQSMATFQKLVGGLLRGSLAEKFNTFDFIC